MFYFGTHPVGGGFSAWCALRAHLRINTGDLYQGVYGAPPTGRRARSGVRPRSGY